MSAIQSISIPTSAESRAQRAEMRAALRERLFTRLDADGSGGVSRQEFAATLQNLPGVGSAGRTAGAGAAADRIGALLIRLDTDGDGQVTRAELDAAMNRRDRAVATEERPREGRQPLGVAGALILQLSGQERRGGSAAEHAQASRRYAGMATPPG